MKRQQQEAYQAQRINKEMENQKKYSRKGFLPQRASAIKEIPSTQYGLNMYEHESGTPVFLINAYVFGKEIKTFAKTKSILVTLKVTDETDSIIVKKWLRTDAEKELYENDPLRKVFTEFVQKAIFEYLCSDNLGLILQEISKSLFEKALVVGQNIQNSEEVAPKSELENQIEDFGMALVSKKIVEAQFESHKGKNYTFKDSLMPNIYKMIKEDINKALLLYFTDVSGDGMSDYVQTKGFEYIKETLSKARENKNNKE